MKEPPMTADLVPILAAGGPIAVVQQARDLLQWAVAHDDPETVNEIRHRANALADYAHRKQLGEDAELAATEIVRRAERGLAILIEQGQHDGTIRRHGGSNPTGMQVASPTDYVTRGEYHGGNGAGIKALRAGTDDDFEEAVDEGREERNLTRTNLVDKLDADANRPPSKRKWRKPGDFHYGKRHIDENRTAERFAEHLAAAADVIEAIHLDDVDPATASAVAASLDKSLRKLRSFATQLAKRGQT
jgi:hypothetical protein